MNRLRHKIREHVKKYKVWYISGGIFVAGVATGVIISNKVRVTNTVVQILPKDSPVYNITQTILERRGHPGWLVRCCETGEVFASQNRAAICLGVDKSSLSKHLNGLADAAGGLHFERLGEAVKGS